MNKNTVKYIVLVLIILLIGYIIYQNYYWNVDTFTNSQTYAIVTTVKHSHQLNDWIKYHLNINFNKLYIVFDDENEDTSTIKQNNNVVVFKNNDSWKNELSTLPNMSMYLNDKKEVMSRQILNVANVQRYALKDNITWLLHIDGDELFYPEERNLDQIFNPEYDTINFSNYEMIPKKDNYQNCFKEGVDFKINPTIFNAYSNGKSAVRVNSGAIVAGVHNFNGKSTVHSNVGKILHYPSCNFDEYVNKYKILGKFSDKWWNSVTIPFKFHTDSRDKVTKCFENSSNNSCVDEIRDYYNKSNVLNPSIKKSDIKIIEFVKNQLN